MPEYYYWIIGVCLAIMVMALIIAINSKTSKNKECSTETEKEAPAEIKEEVEEEKPEENVLAEPEKVEETEEVAKEEPKEKVQKTAAKKEDEKTSDVEEEKLAKTEEKELSKKEKLNRYRVTYDKDKGNWVVKMDGADRASKRCATKEEALKVAKELAEKKDAKLSVHKKDGKFQKKSNVK